MAILTVNGVDMPSPKEMNISYNPIGKSENNAAGGIVMDRIALKRTISLSWGYLDIDNAVILLSAMQGELFMSVAFYDPATSGAYTGTFYAQTCDASPVRYEGGLPIGYKDVSVTLTEK